ncbi:MAG: 50S ribosomal protein L6 [Patescibacteria group bacterium]|nr:50S ribosomal protein L6 [Patescibacteria group bacterium]
MSRIGKKPIPFPTGTTVTVAGPLVTVQGPKGKLECLLHPSVSAAVVDGVVNITVRDAADHKQAALWGLYRSLITNLVSGVNAGYSKQLEISGVGFKAAVSGQVLTLNVGFSHPVAYAIAPGVSVTVDKNVLTVSGADKEKVGQTAAEIRDVAPAEPYKGKGIKYVGEVIRRKSGKLATKTE